MRTEGMAMLGKDSFSLVASGKEKVPEDKSYRKTAVKHRQRQASDLLSSCSVKQSLTDLINDQIGSHYIHT